MRRALPGRLPEYWWKRPYSTAGFGQQRSHLASKAHPQRDLGNPENIIAGSEQTRWWKRARSYAAPFFILAHFFVCGHLFFTYIATIRWVGGASMLPTLATSGDAVILSCLHRRGRWVQVGDVVSFKHPVREDYYAMKRVVAMPGDFVLRDTPLDYNEYDSNDGKARQQSWMVQVPEGHCWVAGDNLDWSRDSRHYGPLPLALIRGKAIARNGRGSWIWQWEKINGLKAFEA